MKYQEFKEKMLIKLTSVIADLENLELQERKVVKVNQSLDAVSVVNVNDEMRKGPTFYIEEMYDYFLNVANKNFSVTVDKVLASIVRGMRMCTSLEDEKNVLNSPWKEKAIIMQVINAERNEELLKSVPHRVLKELDLAIIYRLIVGFSEEDGFSSTIITKDLADTFGKTEEELHERAKIAMEEILPCDIGNGERNFFLVTNKARTLGAVYGFDENVLSRIAEIVGEDLYIIPSSLHECIIIPAYVNEVEELKAIIRDANNNVVAKDEFLSDNPYLYLREKNKVVIA